MSANGVAVAVADRPTGGTVALWTTYSYQAGNGPSWGPYPLGYAMGMATVLLHLGESGVRLWRTTTYQRPDGSTYRLRTEIQ